MLLLKTKFEKAWPISDASRFTSGLFFSLLKDLIIKDYDNIYLIKFKMLKQFSVQTKLTKFATS